MKRDEKQKRSPLSVAGEGDAMWDRILSRVLYRAHVEASGICAHAWLACRGAIDEGGGAYWQCMKCLAVRRDSPIWRRVCAGDSHFIDDLMRE